MDTIFEIVSLLRRQSELERQLIHGDGAAVATEREWEATLRRLASHPQALSAVWHTARALRKTPDAISTRDVADWSSQ